MQKGRKYFLSFFVIVLLTLFLVPLNSIEVVHAESSSDGRLGLPAILHLLLEEKIQPITDYDNDGFDSSIDCNDQATSCTTDCTDSDTDAVSDCLDLCIDNDFDGYGIDNSESIIGNGAVSVSECTVYGSDPCILNGACLGSDCNDANPDIYPTNIELCDGLDNDCDPTSADGSGDPQNATACDGPDSDLCAEGTRSCVDGVLVCNDNTSDNLDICNGADDDCDPASADGSEDPQYMNICDGPDSDLCIEGNLNCIDGVLVCSDNSSDNLDVCNGADDDCDPASADGSEDPQLGTPCDGPDSDLCEEGTRSCVDGALVCSDNSSDNLDICNGADDDCDPASADGSEDPQLGAACDGPDSDLCNEGFNGCIYGAMVCSDTSSDNLDICNGADDDCDPASADGSEDPQFGSACDGPDSDLCAEGTISCEAGALVCNDNTSDNLDVCNGADDDCDPASADGSEDPQLGAACDGPDSDLCAEGTISCEAGALVCSDNTSNTLEICNDLDDDCDGQIDEGLFNPNDNPSCSSYSYLGAIAGDTGSGSLYASSPSEEWLRFRLIEDNNSITYLSATITLTSGPGTDFDLFVYCENCGGALAGSSQNRGSVDTVNIRKDDTWIITDDFDVIVEVRHYSSSLICTESNWQLVINGNTSVSQETCN